MPIYTVINFFLLLIIKKLMGGWNISVTLSVKQSGFTVWRHTWRKNSKCTVMTGNNADLRTVLFQSSVTQRTAHFTQGIPQFPQFICRHHDVIISRHSTSTSVSSNSLSRWTLHDIFLFKYHFLLHILRFLFFFSDNIMADVASKQQTTALFVSSTVTHTQEDTKNWQKRHTWWETCTVPENI
jgi:hypothetical protein